jgi:hypothetical protein
MRRCPMLRRQIVMARAAAACSALALSGCGGDDARDAAGELETGTEAVATLTSDERADVLRDEAQRVEDVVTGSVEDLDEVRSLDALQEETRAVGDELADAAERIRDLEVEPAQEEARDELLDAVDALESDVRALGDAVAGRDLTRALREASSLSISAVQRAVDRVEAETSG